MPRARISPDKGIEIAKAGFDVDTASLGEMMFVSGLAVARLRYTGDLTVGPYSGYMDDRYIRAVFHYPEPFPKIPIVLVASKNPDGSSDQGGFFLNAIPTSSGTARYLPLYTAEIYRDRFELYALRYRIGSGTPWLGSPADNWRFWVFANPID